MKGMDMEHLTNEALAWTIKDIQEALKNSIDMACSGSGKMDMVQKYSAQLTVAIEERDSREWTASCKAAKESGIGWWSGQRQYIRA